MMVGDFYPILTFKTDFSISVLVHFVDLVDYSVNLFQEDSFELSSRNVTTAISVDFLEKFGSFVTLKRKRIRTELNRWQGLVISEISIDI